MNLWIIYYQTDGGENDFIWVVANSEAQAVERFWNETADTYGSTVEEAQETCEVIDSFEVTSWFAPEGEYKIKAELVKETK